MKQNWKLYILQCADGTLYTGITTDVAARFAAHSAGRGAKYTRGRTPLKLVYTETCADHSAALKREIAVKKLPRAEKAALIAEYISQTEGFNMKKKNKIIAFLISLMLLFALLCGCSENEISDSTESDETTQEILEETVPGYEGEKGKPLTVDFTTPGTIAENAEPISSKTLKLCDVVLEYPYSTAQLLESGWNFYSEDIALQTVSANTEASVMGFSLYRGETAYAEIGAFVNSSDSEAAVSTCNITCITVYTAEEGQEDGPTFVLPGGITEASTAADVIAVFGPAIDNPSFESVQTGASLLYYANHEESLISYAFGFREDGTIASVMIFT